VAGPFGGVPSLLNASMRPCRVAICLSLTAAASMVSTGSRLVNRWPPFCQWIDSGATRERRNTEAQRLSHGRWR
jgi:hypothetical protein